MSNKNVTIIFILSTLYLLSIGSMGQDKNVTTSKVKKSGEEKKLKKENKNSNVTPLTSFEYVKKNMGAAILGRPANDRVSLNVIALKNAEVFVEYGRKENSYLNKTPVIKSSNGQTVEVMITNLKADSKYYYEVNYKFQNDKTFKKGSKGYFYTNRKPGSTFAFGVQGDSHPERFGKMFHPELYTVTMNNAVENNLDFYFTIGDDFSIEKLIAKNRLSQQAVDYVYLNQRSYLGILGKYSSIFLVNGNHEQAARYLLDGTADNAAVYAGNARIKMFSLPSPDDFYTGDEKTVKHIGLLRDYYAWQWGDAHFIVLDPYWHSKVAVDNTAGAKEKKKRDLWDITLGSTQYNWLKKTLEESKAKYKFIFAHHVLGTGRGGVEMADQYEWGGKNQKGIWEFDKKRPDWEMPIHKLMMKHNVSIFFQGHDHLFAFQKLDGIVYQSLPNPADLTYTAFNENRYRSGETLPNSGFIKVIVSPEKLKVDYIRSYLPGDATKDHPNGEVAFSYEISSKGITVTSINRSTIKSKNSKISKNSKKNDQKKN